LDTQQQGFEGVGIDALEEAAEGGLAGGWVGAVALTAHAEGAALALAHALGELGEIFLAAGRVAQMGQDHDGRQRPERVNADVFRAAMMVVRGVHGGRRTDLVHQPNRVERPAFGVGDEVNAVEVGERVEHLVNLVAVALAELADFLVGHTRLNLRCAPVMAEERHVGHCHLYGRVQRCRGDGDAAALAAAIRGNAFWVHGKVWLGGFDGADGVSEHAPVIVGLRVENAAGLEAGKRRLPPSDSMSGVSPLVQP
jgi:hypothetical protein